MSDLEGRLLSPGGLSVVFQPVFRVGVEGLGIHGYECLTRGPKGTNLERADVLFEFVRLKRIEAKIDRSCVILALAEARRLPGTPRIAINAFASTLATDPRFSEFFLLEADRNGISRRRLILEIVEHAPAWDVSRFLENLNALKEGGVAIALDDVGLGQSNYKMVVDVNPDYLKIDHYFVSNCHRERSHRAVIESIVELGKQFEAVPIAEGVETPQELATVRTLGVDLIQGYLLGRPNSADEIVAAFAGQAGTPFLAEAG
jgi:EAL domain-containing protein (putative c-di-GMP-specific phosphodiesterase class I)